MCCVTSDFSYSSYIRRHTHLVNTSRPYSVFAVLGIILNIFHSKKKNGLPSFLSKVPQVCEKRKENTFLKITYTKIWISYSGFCSCLTTVGQGLPPT